MKLNDLFVNDFSGGLVLNKSDYEMQKNEVKDVLNFDFDERGKLKTRFGSYNFAGSISATKLFGFSYSSGGYGAGTLVSPFLFFTDASPSLCYRLQTATLTTALSTASTSAVVTSTTFFTAATSTFNIEGDTVTYTAIASGTSFTVTAATIATAHLAGHACNQWLASVTTTDIDGRLGVYGAVLGGSLFLCGFTGAVYTDTGGSFTTLNNAAGAGEDTDCPPGLFATNYRQRIYVAGSGGVHGTLVGTTYRVFYSNANDATAWTSTSYFDVNDYDLGVITGLRTANDRLLIFKRNSIHSYDEVNVRLLTSAVGAYNQEVLQEIDGDTYTFCPSGVFKISGSSFTRVSDPIQSILSRFTPYFNSATPGQRVVTNCFAGSYDRKYYLCLKNIKIPNNESATETISDAVLVYDTIKKSWSLLTGHSQLLSIFSCKSFRAGDFVQKEGMFWYDGDYVYRMFDGSEGGGNTTNLSVGKEITSDKFINGSGTSIYSRLETKLFDFGNPSYWKKIGGVRILVEQGDFNISYKLDKGTHVTDWIPLGVFNDRNKRVNLIDNEGYRIAFLISTNSKDVRSILNGIVVEDIEATIKK